jgi:hypothetical protein
METVLALCASQKGNYGGGRDNLSPSSFSYNQERINHEATNYLLEQKHDPHGRQQRRVPSQIQNLEAQAEGE